MAGVFFAATLMPVAANDTPPSAAIEQARAALNAGNDADALLILQRAAAANPESSNEISALYRLAGSAPSGPLLPAAAGNRNAAWMGFQPRGWIAATAGHDTNINSASSLTTIPIPLLNNLSVPVSSPLLIQEPSAFIGLDGGLELRYPLSPQTRLLLYGQLQTRYNQAEAVFFPHNYYGSGALQHSRGAAEFTASASHTQQWVARYLLLESTSIVTQASYNARPGLEFSLAAEFRTFTYPFFSPVTAQGKLLRFGSRDSGKGLAASLMVGKDSTEGRAPELDRSLSSLTIDWGKDWGVHRFSLHAAFSHADYDATSPLFLTPRQDRNRVLAAEYSYRLNENWKSWQLTPRLIDERNLSNIPLSAYTRRQIMLELRREY